jgi:nitrosocyanin
MKKMIVLPSLLFLSLSSFALDVTLVNHQFEGTKQWLPGFFKVKEGEKVNITLINNAKSGIHGFEVKEYGVKTAVKSGEKKEISFIAKKKGVHIFKCHLHPTHVGGQFEVY